MYQIVRSSVRRCPSMMTLWLVPERTSVMHLSICACNCDELLTAGVYGDGCMDAILLTMKQTNHVELLDPALIRPGTSPPLRTRALLDSVNSNKQRVHSHIFFMISQ